MTYPGQPGRQRGAWKAIVPATATGAAASSGTTFFLAVVVERIHGRGTVSFEMGLLVALFLAAIGGSLAGLCGAGFAWMTRDARGLKVWLSIITGASIVGAVPADVFYTVAIVPHATVPQVHVYWVGVVFVAGVAVGGPAGAIAGRLLIDQSRPE